LSDKPTVRSPIARRKTYELVAERLTEEISSGALNVGDLLPPERELVASFGVGRSSVREALRILESRGVIASRGNGSFVVAPVRAPLNHSLDLLLKADQTDVVELFEVRRILEGEAAALAASRRTDHDLEQMDEAVEAMERALDSESAFIEADLRFHLFVAEATRNRVATHLMHAIRDLLQRSLSSAFHVAGSPERAIEMHGRIVDAIARCDAAGARALMLEHVSGVERDILGSKGRG
jgi:GntR family transcriptional repressor for pyruvate dehydrogenase complex